MLALILLFVCLCVVENVIRGRTKSSPLKFIWQTFDVPLPSTEKVRVLLAEQELPKYSSAIGRHTTILSTVVPEQRTSRHPWLLPYLPQLTPEEASHVLPLHKKTGLSQIEEVCTSQSLSRGYSPSHPPEQKMSQLINLNSLLNLPARVGVVVQLGVVGEPSLLGLMLILALLQQLKMPVKATGINARD